MKIQIAAQNDNRPGLSAEFVRLPELFLKVYSLELLEWASSLQARGPTLEITLWNWPGTTILSPKFQGVANVQCTAVADQITKAVTLFISPASEEDEARVRQHVEALPGILAALRARSQADRSKARGAVAAVFNLPEYFVERYRDELVAWGQNLKTIGMVKTIVLREGNLSDLSPDPEIGAVLLGVKLEARIERVHNDVMRLLISPQSEMDERTIANHVQKMQSVGIKPHAVLAEPPRPGIPAFPDIIGAAAPPADGGV